MRDLGQVVEVEAQVVGLGAGLEAVVLDDLQVVGLLRVSGGHEHVARPREQVKSDLG